MSINIFISSFSGQEMLLSVRCKVSHKIPHKVVSQALTLEGGGGVPGLRLPSNHVQVLLPPASRSFASGVLKKKTETFSSSYHHCFCQSSLLFYEISSMNVHLLTISTLDSLISIIFNSSLSGMAQIENPIQKWRGKWNGFSDYIPWGDSRREVVMWVVYL